MTFALESLDFSDLEVTREIAAEATRDVTDEAAHARALAESMPSVMTRAADPVSSPVEASFPTPRVVRAAAPIEPDEAVHRAPTVPVDPAPETQRAPRISHTRLRRPDAVPSAPCVFGAHSAEGDGGRYLEALGEDRALLRGQLNELATCLDAIAASTAAAGGNASLTLRSFAQDVSDLHDALTEVQGAMRDARLACLVGSATTLGVYLKGLCLFAGRFLSALAAFGRTVQGGEPDWRSFAEQATASCQTHFHCLTDQVRADLAALDAAHRTDPGDTRPVFGETAERLEELFFSAFWLAESVTRELA